ncbi:MAG: hypothetical protein A2017_15535 [Lentisphaerae bacterium GWF2_44_16]|nr:MAG: hypothetical protein A2017_15535 [Lentisphaerae bacterium GWF2_44_16]
MKFEITKPENVREKILPVRKLSMSEGNHFFGYFDKYQEDVSGRYALAHETDFVGRQPTAKDKAVIGMIDMKDGNKFIKLAETKAFCWQQGSMLQWLPGEKAKIIFNDRKDGKYISRIYDVVTGKERELCMPVYCLSADGSFAMGLNFSRLDKERPGYGYAGIPDPFENNDHPDNDGIYFVDIRNNTSKLVISLDEIVKIQHLPSMENYKSWFNHMLISPDNKRFAFFHRWRQPNGWHLTRMFTANVDGSEIYPLNLDDMSSHYTWCGDDKIICFANRRATGWGNYLFTDKTQKTEIIGEGLFNGDGHCSYSKDGKWMLTDTYPDTEKIRTLILLDIENGIRYNIGRFYSVEWFAPCRCDLHPRWSRDNKTVFIDSSHEGERQIYAVDVSSLVWRNGK